MKTPIYWVDAFTHEPFGGNPAAVVPLEAWPEAALMQRIAFENNLSETAFIVRTGPGRWRIRWFTPAVEVDLCGHATLASAKVVFDELGESGEAVVFESASGPLTVRRAGPLLEMDFPARPAVAVTTPPELSAALGAAPLWTGRTERLWLCVYATAAEVERIAPDHPALARITPGRMIVTAPGPAGGVDFVSRFFAPDAGVPEDPVTGSAHCTLTPHWAGRLGKDRLTARQVSRRGGDLECTLRGDRVAIAGRARLYLRGEIHP